MNKLVELIYWIRFFLSPFLVAAFLALVIYTHDKRFLWLAILLLLTGAVVGSIVAERIRRKHGTTHYAGKIHETNDVMSYDELCNQKGTGDE